MSKTKRIKALKEFIELEKLNKTRRKDQKLYHTLVDVAKKQH